MRRARKRPASAGPGAAPDKDVGKFLPTTCGCSGAVLDKDIGEYSPIEPVKHSQSCAPAAPATRVRRKTTPAMAQGSPQMEDVEPDWAGKPFDGDCLPNLPWADHVVNVLVSNGHLPSHSQKKVQLQAWSDCSGINAEKFAWADLQDAIRRIIGAEVSLTLYYTCDSDARSIAFAKANHHPRHVGTNMTQRNFTSGLFWSTSDTEDLPMPPAGVDLYVGTYPCSPWSRRGLRTGWNHPSVEPFRIGLQTICHIQPAVWMIELGEIPDMTALDEILSDIQKMLEAEGRKYIIQVVRSLGPQAQGYPIRRPRTYFLGWRQDVSPDPTALVAPLHTLTSNPVGMTSNYRGFLNISHIYDWSGVGNFYVDSALQYMSGKACLCACNPYVLCPVHACRCGKCGHDGLQCAWRALLQQMLEKEGLMAAAAGMAGRMTYINALEMQGGVGPTQPRARTLLNVVAMLPQSHPLNETLLLVDKSQNPPFGSLPADGVAPTLTTTSQLWCMSAGRELTTPELAALMGLDMKQMVFTGQSESWFRKRLGLTVHVPNCGLVLAAAMAQPLKALLAMS